MGEDFKENAEFMEWLNAFQPDWELEYSGNIKGMYEAWLNGYQCGANRYRDPVPGNI